MAVFTVNSTADILRPPVGTVTLRSAIQAANTTPGPDTINIPLAGTYKTTTIGTATDNSAGEFAIADAGDLTIQNTSGGGVTVDGGGLNRVFDVDPAGSAIPFTVTFQGLVISGGHAYNDGGGGIDVHGAADVVLNQSAVTANLAGINSSDSAGTDGGGIAMEPGSIGSLRLNGTRVSGNIAGQGGGGIAALGSGTVVIGPQSLISENAAAGAEGGGGILVKGSPLNIDGAVISNNRILAVAGTTPGSGGGIENDGAGLVAITGSMIEDNTSGGDGGGYADAGLATLSVVNSFVLDNVAAGDGGGLAAGGPLVALTNVTVSGNTSQNFKIAQFPETDKGGGGVFLSGMGTTRVTDSTIVGNTAFGFGGGIEDVKSAELIVTGSTVADNRALFYDGGGICLSTAGNLTISDSLFRDNASGESGGAILTGSVGVELDATAISVEVVDSRFTGNSAIATGGGVYLNGIFSILDSTFDANRANFGGALILLPPSLTINALTNDTIVANAAANRCGGCYFSGSDTTTMTMADDTIDGNTGSAIGGDGGVEQSGGNLVVQGTILAGNTAAGSPGDYLPLTGTLTDKGGNLLGSTAGTGGKFGVGTLIGDPKLGPLVDNGGPRAGAPSDSQVVPTQALLPGSPAFAKGVAAGSPTNDGRGFARPAKPAIGAYEPQYAANATANQVYVENLFEVLLDRAADPASLASSVNFLNGGGSGVKLVQILQASTEFRDVEATQLYRRYFDRTASAAEVANLANFLAVGNTPEQVAAIFIGTPEFFGDSGTNNDVFVEAVYQDTLGRAASPVERGGWVQLLAQGGTRTGVATLFVNSTEYLDLLIEAEYPVFLGRLPTPAEEANLARAWPGFTGLQIEAALLGFGEAFARRT